MNLKEALRDKKVRITVITVIAILIVIIAVVVGFSIKKQKSTSHVVSKAEEGKLLKEINLNELKHLVPENYDLTVAKITDKSIIVDVAGIKKEEMKNFINSIAKAETLKGKDTVEIIFFTNKDDIKKVDKFYVEGLQSIAKMDFINKITKIENFNEVKAEKAQEINNYDSKEIRAQDDLVNIKLDLELDKPNAKDVVAQSKAFIAAFKSVNENIKNIQLDINHDSKENVYSFNAEFDNILKDIKTLPL